MEWPRFDGFHLSKTGKSNFTSLTPFRASKGRESLQKTRVPFFLRTAVLSEHLALGHCRTFWTGHSRCSPSRATRGAITWKILDNTVRLLVITDFLRLVSLALHRNPFLAVTSQFPCVWKF